MAHVWTGYFHLGLISMRETSIQHTIGRCGGQGGNALGWFCHPPFTNRIDNVSFSFRTKVSLLCSKYLGNMEHFEGIYLCLISP